MYTASVFLQDMLILFGIAAIGFIARRRKVMSKHTDEVLTGLTLFITLPALILFSLDIPFSTTLIKEFTLLIMMSIYFLGIAILIGAGLRKRTKLPQEQKQVYEGLLIFGNQGFIGYAVAFALFGERGIVYLTMFNLPYFFLIWTYGIYLFTKGRVSWKAVFFNPGVIATLIGTLLFLLPIGLPRVISNGLEMVGKMTLPLSMLLIGSLLSSVKGVSFLSLIKSTSLWKIAIIKLLVIPLTLLPFVYIVPAPLLFIAVITAGMPCAPTISLYAQKYGGDAHYASIGVMFTTLLCMATIPLLYGIVNLITN